MAPTSTPTTRSTCRWSTACWVRTGCRRAGNGPANTGDEAGDRAARFWAQARMPFLRHRRWDDFVGRDDTGEVSKPPAPFVVTGGASPRRAQEPTHGLHRWIRDRRPVARRREVVDYAALRPAVPRGRRHRVVEAWGDATCRGKLTDFHRAVAATEDEGGDVFLGQWPDKATRLTPAWRS